MIDLLVGLGCGIFAELFILVMIKLWELSEK